MVSFIAKSRSTFVRTSSTRDLVMVFKTENLTCYIDRRMIA
jgi:hypothetical protein